MEKTTIIQIKDNTKGKELIEKIYKSFYKKNAIEELLNKAVNDQAISALSEKYSDLNVVWQSDMNEMGKYILGEYYGYIDYNMNVNFMRNIIEITMDDTQPDYDSLINQMKNSDLYNVL